MKLIIKQQISAIFAAMSFLTRIPMPQWVVSNTQAIADASRWFSLIGLLIGGIAALVLYSLTMLLGQPLAVVLTLVFIIILTGAFHEDGLADLCDGFGGGWDKTRKLAIMKDSQIGTYGVLALVTSFSIKMVALLQLPLLLACTSLIVCHAGSRAIAGLVELFLPYARQGTNNKTPQKGAKSSLKNRLILFIFGTLPFFLLSTVMALILIVIWLLVFIYLVHLMDRHIQGYTGDTIGAAQQIIEITGLICFAIYHYQTTILL